ncbi:MAG TPA: nuclear transport factor 2 family protein [Longimicrobiales bacterium]|nr:nuclear transport factor 2 family protein [Longimicrobiales bacterium]
MRRIATAFVSLALVGAFRGELAAQEDVAAVRSEIERINAQIERWYEAGHVDSIAAVMAEDVWQLPPQMPPTVGREALRRFWSDAVGAGKWQFTLTTKDVVVSEPLAAERGTYALTFTPGPEAPEHFAEPFEDSGNYVVVWRKDPDGAWRVLWDAPVSTAGAPPGN